MLTENQVSASALAEIFGSAFMDVSDLDSKSFIVDGEKLTIRVSIVEQRHLIKFFIFNKMKNINMSKASLITNKMNEDYILNSFSAIEHEGQVIYSSSYYMSYRKGLIKFQLIDNIKNFERIALEAALEEFDGHF